MTGDWNCRFCGKINDTARGMCECGTVKGLQFPGQSSAQSLGCSVRTKKQKPEIVLEPTVKPLSVKIPKAAPRKEGDTLTALEWSDSHFPFQDDEVLAIVQAIAEDMQPDFLVHKGDLLDARELSRFDKDPNRKESLQDEIDQARAHLATMRIASPDSTFVLLEGNHEDRLRRTLWNLEGPAAVLGQLTTFKKAMTWPSLLGLEELGIEFIEYGEQSKKSILPKFITKHGSVVRARSGATAAAEQSKYNKSGSSGHTHRLGAVWHRDSNGSHVWVETGCTCSLDPDYCVDPDWQNGCVFWTFDKRTGAATPELIFIHNGLAVFRGKTYGEQRAEAA